jgi:hypothetical protein
MLVQEHIRQLIKLARPRDDAEYDEFYASIKPIKFGNTVSWTAAGLYDLARYQIPTESSYTVICRVEVVEVDQTAGSADFGFPQVPPDGFAYWEYQTSAGTPLKQLTPQDAPVQRLLDADDYLFAVGGNILVLVGNFVGSPDANNRQVRTLVYAYNLSSVLADRLARSQAEIPSE